MGCSGFNRISQQCTVTFCLCLSSVSKIATAGSGQFSEFKLPEVTTRICTSILRSSPEQYASYDICLIPLSECVTYDVVHPVPKNYMQNKPR